MKPRIELDGRNLYEVEVVQERRFTTWVLAKDTNQAEAVAIEDAGSLYSSDWYYDSPDGYARTVAEVPKDCYEVHDAKSGVSLVWEDLVAEYEDENKIAIHPDQGRLL